MPPITFPRAPAIGSLRDIQRPEEIAPRPEYATGIRSTKANELEAQAVQSDIGAAGEVGELGQQTQQLAVELLKPLEKLRQSREVMQAASITTNATLDARRKVLAVKSEGIPYTEWLGEAAKRFDEVEREARQTAEKISPAAGFDVAQQLAAERLNLLTNMTAETVKVDLNTQLADYHIYKELAFNDYRDTKDPLKREIIEDRVFRQLAVLAYTGVLNPDAAAKEKINWLKDTGKHRVIEKGVDANLEAAQRQADNEKFLSLDDRKNAVNAAQDYISNRLKDERKAEITAAHQLKFDQDTLYVHFIRRAREVKTIPEAEAIINEAENLGVSAAPGKVPAGLLRAEQADAVISVANHQIQVMKAGPQEYHDPRREATIVSGMLKDINAWPQEAIDQEYRVNGTSRKNLSLLRNTLLKEKSFRHTAMFHQYMHDITRVFPLQPGIRNILGFGDRIAEAHAEEQRIFLMYLLDVSKATEGVLDEEQVRTYGKPAFDLAKNRIESMTFSQFPTAP
jgi:hypothetical protein